MNLQSAGIALARTIQRHIHSHVWQLMLAVDWALLFFSMLFLPWARWGFRGGWVPKARAPKMSQEEATSPCMTWPQKMCSHSCHIPFVKARAKSWPVHVKGKWTSPFMGSASWAGDIAVVIFGKHTATASPGKLVDMLTLRPHLRPIE